MDVSFRLRSSGHTGEVPAIGGLSIGGLIGAPVAEDFLT
jgi:hypothetical protein